MRCKVALVPRMGEDIVVEEVELAEPRDDEVRIRVMTCTICHTDIHGLKGEHGSFEGPGTAGHEIAGIIDKVGSGVTYVKPGDRVLSSLLRQGCGKCYQCLRDRHWFCENLPPMSFRMPSPYTRNNGEVCIQTQSGASGFAEYTNAHEAQLCKLDDDIPFAIGSVMACGFMSGFGAVLNRCRIQPGESIAIIGCGGVGLSAVMGARFSGANPVIAVDTMDVKLDAAKKFGATHFINPNKNDPVEEVKKITHGYGVDHSLVATAGSGVKRMTFDLTAGYGQLVVVGHARYEDEYAPELNYMDFLAGKRVTGSVMGAITLRRDIPLYMDMYRNGLIDIDSLLTHRFSLDRIKEAIDNAQKGALKNIIVIGEENI
ncbi:MAG: alcohol dehydrogenase catalytic domain-containing protein [Desulfobacteraceae bacterium]